jgi:hypothetical protein
MKLLTLNFLACTKCDNFPLNIIDSTEKKKVETELNIEFIKNFISKLNYDALKQSSEEVFFFLNK